MYGNGWWLLRHRPTRPTEPPNQYQDARTADGGPLCTACGEHRSRQLDGLCPICDDDPETREAWITRMAARDMARREAS